MYKIINQPKYIPLQSYADEQEKYINNIKNIPGIVSIGNFGNVGAAGLSDLDFIVIVEDDFNPKHSIKLSCKPGLSILDGKISTNNLKKNKDKYNNQILLHGPVIVSRSQLKELNYIIYAPSIDTLYGENIDEEEFLPEKQTFEYLKLMYLIDFSSARLTHFALSDTNKILHKRGWLTRTWSLTHSETLCNSIGITLSEKANSTLSDIRNIRTQWIKDYVCSDEVFLENYSNAKELLIEILTKALNYESSFLKTEYSGHSDIKILRGDKSLVCSKSTDTPSANAIATPYKILNKQKWYFECNMPYQYGLHLTGYNFPSNSQHSLTSSNKEYLNCLNKRGDVARIHRKFLFNKNMTFAMGAYIGLPIPPHNPLIKTLDMLNWKILK